MKAKKEATTKTEGNDPRRFAYMIAWRDRYIAALQERLAGWEEKDVLLCSLLHYALTAMANAEDGRNEYEVEIPKDELTKRLGEWECHAEDQSDSYRVCFTKKPKDIAPDGDTEERPDGGKQKKD